MACVDQRIGNDGYAAVFILLALGLFSLPISDEVMVLLVWYFTKIDMLHYSFSLIAIFSGSLIGLLMSHVLGKRLGRPLLDWLGKWFKIQVNGAKKQSIGLKNTEHLRLL